MLYTNIYTVITLIITLCILEGGDSFVLYGFGFGMFVCVFLSHSLKETFMNLYDST